MYRKQAEFFKALAHPTRLLIVDKLLEEERCVGSIEKLLELKQANVSQHLNILKNAGLVDYDIQGRKRCYYITEPKRISNMLRI
jgi:ArsR family transcriptional regulator